MPKFSTNSDNITINTSSSDFSLPSYKETHDSSKNCGNACIDNNIKVSNLLKNHILT